jgi:hypothetical protein
MNLIALRRPVIKQGNVFIPEDLGLSPNLTDTSSLLSGKVMTTTLLRKVLRTPKMVLG